MTRAGPTTSELLMFISGYMQRVLRSEARKRGIRWNALMVLNDLSIRGPCTATELSQIEQLRAPTVTVLVRQMHTRGWILKTPSTSDARSSVISITATGVEELRRAN